MSDEPPRGGDPAPEAAGPPVVGWAVPRVLGFYRDVVDERPGFGVAVHSYPVAWGVVLPDDRVAHWAPVSPVGVTVSDSIEDVCVKLDAWVGNLDAHQLVWRDGELVLMPGPVSGGVPASADDTAAAADKGEQVG